MTNDPAAFPHLILSELQYFAKTCVENPKFQGIGISKVVLYRFKVDYETGVRKWTPDEEKPVFSYNYTLVFEMPEDIKDFYERHPDVSGEDRRKLRCDSSKTTPFDNLVGAIEKYSTIRKPIPPLLRSFQGFEKVYREPVNTIISKQDRLEIIGKEWFFDIERPGDTCEYADKSGPCWVLYEALDGPSASVLEKARIYAQDGLTDSLILCQILAGNEKCSNEIPRLWKGWQLGEPTPELSTYNGRYGAWHWLLERFIRGKNRQLQYTGRPPIGRLTTYHLDSASGKLTKAEFTGKSSDGREPGYWIKVDELESFFNRYDIPMPVLTDHTKNKPKAHYPVGLLLDKLRAAAERWVKGFPAISKIALFRPDSEDMNDKDNPPIRYVLMVTAPIPKHSDEAARYHNWAEENCSHIADDLADVFNSRQDSEPNKGWLWYRATPGEELNDYLVDPDTEIVLFPDGISIGLTNDGPKQKQKRHSSLVKERCRKIASEQWDKDETLTIKELAEYLVETKKVALKKNETPFTTDTVSEWIKELCPNRSPGRRKKQI